MLSANSQSKAHRLQPGGFQSLSCRDLEIATRCSPHQYSLLTMIPR